MTTDKQTPKIRPLYEEHGAEGYYREFADAYENPHLPEIQALVERNFYRLDCSDAVLDFAAGGGEVASALQGLGAKHIIGCDPFTHALFERKTALTCLQLSFKDVIREGLSGQYSMIISSFAMHLCPLKDLFPLTWNLLQAAPLLVIITPHKRPELEKLQGIQLLWEDSVETVRGKKVRMKAYGNWDD
ncbi:MAG: class I SAM-dependent methyltransferase [Saprospiraceae bacterium]|nr:class I SAM-dependent methyltransferase [Saprospiraceae bacterium]